MVVELVTPNSQKVSNSARIIRYSYSKVKGTEVAVP